MEQCICCETLYEIEESDANKPRVVCSMNCEESMKKHHDFLEIQMNEGKIDYTKWDERDKYDR